jgi:aldose sugar dehydrogenase
MKKTTLLFLAFFTFSLTISAQDKMDKKLIETTINTFMDGWAVGDSTKAGKALHPAWQIKFFREDKFTVINRADYLSGFKPKERYKDLKTNILSVEITGNIAMAKTEIINQTHIYLDYLSLIKTNDGWFIVDKVTFKKDKK